MKLNARMLTLLACPVLLGGCGLYYRWIDGAFISEFEGKTKSVNAIYEKYVVLDRKVKDPSNGYQFKDRETIHNTSDTWIREITRYEDYCKRHASAIRRDELIEVDKALSNSKQVISGLQEYQAKFGEAVYKEALWKQKQVLTIPSSIRSSELELSKNYDPHHPGSLYLANQRNLKDMAKDYEAYDRQIQDFKWLLKTYEPLLRSRMDLVKVRKATDTLQEIVLRGESDTQSHINTANDLQKLKDAGIEVK